MLQTETLTRDSARAAWRKSGLTAQDLGPQDLRDLRRHINDSMIRQGAMNDTLRCRQRFTRAMNSAGQPCLDLQCKAYYFDSRQAITIEPDGFVGFAGWADDTNIRPILAGFVAWLKGLHATPAT